MMTYPIALRDGSGYCIARVILPDDITLAEAQRVGKMIRTLALDCPPEERTG
jgi:hypothetical protein